MGEDRLCTVCRRTSHLFTRHEDGRFLCPPCEHGRVLYEENQRLKAQLEDLTGVWAAVFGVRFNQYVESVPRPTTWRGRLDAVKAATILASERADVAVAELRAMRAVHEAEKERTMKIVAVDASRKTDPDGFDLTVEFPDGVRRTYLGCYIAEYQEDPNRFVEMRDGEPVMIERLKLELRFQSFEDR